MLKNGPEVNFDELPLGTVTEVAENSAGRSQGKLGQKHLGCGKEGGGGERHSGNSAKDGRHRLKPPLNSNYRAAG